MSTAEIRGDARTHAITPPWRRTAIFEAPLVVFFVLACALSWAAWLPLAWRAPSDSSTQRGGLQYLHLVGTLGPLIAAYLLTAWRDGGGAVRALTERSFRWRGAWGWLAFAFLGPTLMYLAAVVGVGIATGSWAELTEYGKSDEYPELPRVVYWVASIMFYGFGEQVGWRGYLIPHLQKKWSALGAALMFTPLWAFWHIPLFWAAPGLSQMGATGIWGWLVSLALGSVLLSWLFNATSSVLPAAIFHGTMDIAFTSPGPDLVQSVVGGEVALLAIGVLAFMDPRTLRTWRSRISRRWERPSPRSAGNMEMKQ